MAGKGGGAWKVAYADFVTAMMAFFLVMWLVAQDQKVKESIARYFQQPAGMDLLGESSRPKQTGGLFQQEVNGPVPGPLWRVEGRTIAKFENPRLEEDDTLVVAEWVLGEPSLSRHWQRAAVETLQRAEKALPAMREESTLEDTARRMLAQQMRTEFQATAQRLPDPLMQDVLAMAYSKVDWTAIAEECLLQCQK